MTAYGKYACFGLRMGCGGVENSFGTFVLPFF